MATLHKFDALVCTTQVEGSWESWIDERQLPAAVSSILREKFPGEGTAWLIRQDRWFAPRLEAGEVMSLQTRCMALNDATLPCIVSGNVDYSQWDD